jgi:hypothetical protein
MGHLTLQEVIDRVNSNYPIHKESKAASVRDERDKAESPHRPEFYVPRIARIFVSLLLALEAGRVSGLYH